jgi:glutamate synthase domain-containing protein 1
MSYTSFTDGYMEIAAQTASLISYIGFGMLNKTGNKSMTQRDGKSIHPAISIPMKAISSSNALLQSNNFVLFPGVSHMQQNQMLIAPATWSRQYELSGRPVPDKPS